MLGQRGAKVREAIITRVNDWSAGCSPAKDSLEHEHPDARKSHL